MAVTMVVTSFSAYGSTIFIGLDELHPHLCYPPIVELIGQKMWLTIGVTENKVTLYNLNILISQESSVSKFNQLHVVIFWFIIINNLRFTV